MLLPGTAAVVVPAVLVASDGADFDALRVVVGAPFLLAGFAMWVWTVRLFARIGRGTLAPWDPTKRLVVEGESAALDSAPHALAAYGFSSTLTAPSCFFWNFS